MELFVKMYVDSYTNLFSYNSEFLLQLINTCYNKKTSLYFTIVLMNCFIFIFCIIPGIN